MSASLPSMSFFIFRNSIPYILIKKSKKAHLCEAKRNINAHYPLFQKGVDAKGSGGIFHLKGQGDTPFKLDAAVSARDY
jgi:hypothetical protein